MPLKYIWGNSDIMFGTGMAHGVLFILYSINLLIVFLQFKWKFNITVLAFLASFVPFGTFYADKKWFKNPENNSNATT
jgi:integral membrane protein